MNDSIFPGRMNTGTAKIRNKMTRKELNKHFFMNNGRPIDSVIRENADGSYTVPEGVKVTKEEESKKVGERKFGGKP
jgi:hypothetical protein